MIMYSIVRKIDVFEFKVEYISESFQFRSVVSGVVRETISIYKKMTNDIDKKTELPIHLIIGTMWLYKIKVHKIPKCRQPFDPVEKLAGVDWVLISPGIKA